MPVRRTEHRTIRPETPGDAAAIAQIVQTAFENHPHSNQTEHLLVAALRDADALLVSLVAEEAGEILGYVAFSSVTMDDQDCGWVGLAPVVVRSATGRIKVLVRR